MAGRCKSFSSCWGSFGSSGGWGRVEEKEGGLNMVAASFRTRDPFDQVDAWYREQLGPDFTRETGHIRGGERRDGGEWIIRVEAGGSGVLSQVARPGRGA